MKPEYDLHTEMERQQREPRLTENEIVDRAAARPDRPSWWFLAAMVVLCVILGALLLSVGAPK